jgi:Tfp pilus assembly protein PilV
MKFTFRKDPNRRRTKKSGYSLMEVMVGSMVMTLVLTGSFSALSQGVDMSNRARNEQFADRLLNNEIQYLRTLSWKDIEDNSDIADLDEKTYSHSETLSFFKSRGYVEGDIPMRNLQLDADFTKSHGNSRQNIELTLSWQEINGRSMSRTVTFIYSRDGIYDSFCPIL